MALDVSEAGARQRRMNLQQRLWEARHPAIRGEQRRTSAQTLFREIRNYLLQATDRRLLEGGQQGVFQKLKSVPGKDGLSAIMVGDRRNFRRDPSLPHFRRTCDGAWFDFQLQLREHAEGIDIVAYDFELRLPNQSGFVRFDLNPDAHDNQDDGLRSHMHVSSDDDGMSVPAPVMSPFELLDVMVHGLISKGRVRRTDFVTGVTTTSDL